MGLKPIENDEDLVKVIDELKHQIKPGASSAVFNVMCREFNHVLNEFISRWHLGEGKHTFAEWPNRVVMRCTHCGKMEEMARLDVGDHAIESKLPLYLCKCGCHHTFAGSYEEFAKDDDDDDEGWGGPFGH